MCFLMKGGLTLNPGYPRVYAPVLRSPLLFHHNTGLYGPTNPAQPRVTQSTPNLYFPNTTYPRRQPSRYTVQTSSVPYNLQAYSYYSNIPRAIVPSQMPFPSYTTPTVSYVKTPTITYVTTVSSKGLSLILIATLILVALDLMIVRPQKRYIAN